MKGSLLLYSLKLSSSIFFLPVKTAHWLYLFGHVL